MARSAKQSPLTGKAGEYIVAGQIMLRGMNVYWPANDTGCDLKADNNCRVQVRTAHLYHRKEYGPIYFFPLPRNRRMPNSDKTTKLVARKKFAEVCDFVVFFGIEQNRFWIVPAALCDECTGVELGIESSLRRFAGSVVDMRQMKDLGYSNYKISRHYGIQQCSVKQFLASGKDFIGIPVATRMRACENKWSSILEFGQPTTIDPVAPLMETEEPC
jgi:hypothetical protein